VCTPTCPDKPGGSFYVEAIRTGIGQVLVWNAEVEPVNIQVFVDSGHVTSKDTARSWPKCQEAENAAWRSPRVTDGNNEIRVER
jgi:hypothetical protein